jgi:hypothetical protein
MLLRERDPGSIELQVSLSQLKKLYVSLFRRLHDGGAAAMLDDMDEDDMLLTLQTYLQRRAAQAGVDATIHSEWEKFLGIHGAAGCATRHAGAAPDRSAG